MRRSNIPGFALGMPARGGSRLVSRQGGSVDEVVTQIGELRTVELPEGSRMTLNTNTRICLHLRRDERRIQVTRGEAYFCISEDARRPFVIDAAGHSVTCQMAQFSLRLRPGQLQVLVIRGSVQLSCPAAETAGLPAMLAGHEIASVVDSQARFRQTSGPEMERLSGWRHGWLIFSETPLAEVVAEFNRYCHRNLVIVDSSIARIRIGGRFRCVNVDAFLSLLQQGFPVAVEHYGTDTLLKRRRLSDA